MMGRPDGRLAVGLAPCSSSRGALLLCSRSILGPQQSTCAGPTPPTLMHAHGTARTQGITRLHNHGIGQCHGYTRSHGRSVKLLMVTHPRLQQYTDTELYIVLRPYSSNYYQRPRNWEYRVLINARYIGNRVLWS